MHQESCGVPFHDLIALIPIIISRKQKVVGAMLPLRLFRGVSVDVQPIRVCNATRSVRWTVTVGIKEITMRSHDSIHLYTRERYSSYVLERKVDLYRMGGVLYNIVMELDNRVARCRSIE
jgi:hypothetical protein